MARSKKTVGISLLRRHAVTVVGTGCDNCPLKTAGARHVDIQPDGADDPDLLIVGQAPGLDEDFKGSQFVGPGGRLLRKHLRQLGLTQSAKIRYTTIVRTRPPVDRNPLPEEIAACRSKLEEDIARTKPRVILALGSAAQRWFNQVPNIDAWRGRTQIFNVAGHQGWLISSYDPEKLLQLGLVDEYDRELRHFVTWKLDLKKCQRMLEWTTKPTAVEDNFDQGYRCLDPALGESDPTAPKTNAEAMEALRELFTRTLPALAGTRKRIAFDYETSSAEPLVKGKPRRKVRPYGKGAKVASIGLSDGDRSWAFSYEHPRSVWTAAELSQIRTWWREFLMGDIPKVVHRVEFEGEWSAVIFGWDTLDNEESWEDTQAGSWILDSRNKDGAHSLAGLVQSVCGVAAKPDPVNRDRIERTPLTTLLPYNARDCWATWHAAEVVLDARIFPNKKLTGIYRSQMERAFDVILVQRGGVPISLKENKILGEALSRDLVESEAALRKKEEIRQFERITGSAFNPSSNPNASTLLRDMLGLDPGGSKVGEEELKAMKHPMANAILAHRKLVKNYGTYVRDMADPTVHLWPGDIIRPTFNARGTETRRFSSDGPNFQNWPKRGDDSARRQIVAPPGFKLLAMDYGQVEFRCFPMATLDKNLIDIIKTGYDVHAEWRDRISKACPPWLAQFDGDKKRARTEAKGWTFGLIYGSGVKTMTQFLKVVPRDTVVELRDRFIQDFPGVFDWHAEMINSFLENGYVENMEGFRRYAPLNPQDAINNPIQSTACEFIVKALRNCTNKFRETGNPAFVPLAQIHDDLTFLVEDNEVDELVEEVARLSLKPAITTPYCNVPLSVEVSLGQNWREMKEVAEFSSDKVFPV